MIVLVIDDLCHTSTVANGSWLLCAHSPCASCIILGPLNVSYNTVIPSESFMHRYTRAIVL